LAICLIIFKVFISIYQLQLAKTLNGEQPLPVEFPAMMNSDNSPSRPVPITRVQSDDLERGNNSYQSAYQYKATNVKMQQRPGDFPPSENPESL
jgi:hypothetical protein